LNVTVPQDAQQMLVFLAPQTSGDFKTLVNAVRARPGVFVRTSQDLNQATLDRSRLESYLMAIRSLNDADPSKLQEAAPLLARSLTIKLDDKCLERAAQLQAPCLMQGQASLIMDDLHSTSIVDALTSGPAGDLAMQASSTAQAGLRLLQSLCCIGDGYRAHLRLLPYRAVSIHSGTDRAAWESACPDAEHAAFVPESEIRAGGGSAGG
jgi:hypothetical protein